MRGIELEIIGGYEELSELKNLRVLDVSGERYSNVELWVIRGLLQAEVRIENLEFLDCSMTFFEDHELKEFVENHPKLKTVAAISTRCDNLHIPTIDLLNNNSTDSTIKSLEYAVTNDRKDLTEVCIRFITDKLDRIHDQLNDSEISGFLNVLRYALIESKYELIKCLAIQCFATSSFFETERFFKSFWLEITGIVELLFTSCKHLKRSEIRRKIAISWILTVSERMVDLLKFGNILQDRLLNFIIEKTIELSCQSPGNIRKVSSIFIETNRFMSLDQYTAISNNKTVIKELFDFSHRLITLDPSSYKQVMEVIVRCLNQASESTLNYLVSNCQAVEKCYEQVMIVFQSPSTDSQNNLSKIVLKLMSVLNLNYPDEKAKALTSCSILSLLLAKSLVDDREYVNTILGEFNDSWGRSKILAYQNITEVMNAIFTSEYSTDESIRFGLMLTSTFVNAKICESTEYWNWVRTTLEYIRNNEMCTKKTRESASAVLNEMSTIEKKWISH
ncbi:hypothetical protein B9Z55_004937 [Caenorhabditis nigoni]|uniref:Uncharacterized protein n=1 Tax=Caenorhabditis nigoni TaxID=1611254 RepID=A0A2G5UYY2_9PELO|nr:hypothetical protein B9Z55_004937 [Caenorhabditis nigoni]